MFAGWFYFQNRWPAVPQRPLRIGFEVNPPFQIRSENGFSGLSIETVEAAAKRAGIRLEWVETGTSSYEAFEKGLVDLWPLMTDLPERRRLVHFSKPWVIGSDILLLRAGSPAADASFAGRIGFFHIPLHSQLVRSAFPRARQIGLAEPLGAVSELCKGKVDAAFIEQRAAMQALKNKPAACASTTLRVQQLPELKTRNCVASTFEAAGAADLLRREIGDLFRDGTLAEIMAKYSAYGLDTEWATFEMMDSAERTRWAAWGALAFSAALFPALWLTFSLRQRKRVERALRDSEQRFRTIFQQAGVGVAQISLDGKIEFANDRYWEVVGHRPDQLLGKSTVEISRSEDLVEQLRMLPKLMSGEIQSFSTEKRYAREDGRAVWASLCKSLVRDAAGNAKHLIAVVEEITKRKEAEAALRESEERFRYMADSAPVMIWVSGVDKLCTFVNRAWLEFKGRTLEEELGDGWATGVHPEDRPRCINTYHSSFEARNAFQNEYRLRRADGEYRDIVAHGRPRFAADGRFSGYIGSCLDVTDLKHSYEQHLATQKLESLGVLATGVAHDFNNLLGAIIARAESALGGLAADCAVAADVHQIHLTALRAAEIVSQMMTYASQETAPVAAVDLSKLVMEMIELLNVSIPKGAILKTDLAPDLPSVDANPAELRQVIMNLIINASEALEGAPGSISVSTAEVKDSSNACGGVRLEVEDTGCGMTDDVKARIFDPFFTTRFVGRGLGLSAVQGIVRRHGGTIQVDTTPGKGSRFTVSLPSSLARHPGALHPGLPESGAWLPAEAGSRAAKSCGTILFVEDEESLRSVVARNLRAKGVEVVEAGDGETAIEVLKSTPAGLEIILLDVTLPGISGAELIDEIRRFRPGAKVILSTAYSREMVTRGLAGRGYWGFIRKPYLTSDLIAVLRQASDESAVATVIGDPGANGIQ
jgi:PAS domain S-box-containing protein